jgi:hypothetical protein
MKYQSELLGAIHETAVGLHKIGVISETEMREYDRDCLVRPSVPIAEEKGSSYRLDGWRRNEQKGSSYRSGSGCGFANEE